MKQGSTWATVSKQLLRVFEKNRRVPLPVLISWTAFLAGASFLILWAVGVLELTPLLVLVGLSVSAFGFVSIVYPHCVALFRRKATRFFEMEGDLRQEALDIELLKIAHQEDRITGEQLTKRLLSLEVLKQRLRELGLSVPDQRLYISGMGKREQRLVFWMWSAFLNMLADYARHRMFGKAKEHCSRVKLDPPVVESSKGGDD